MISKQDDINLSAAEIDIPTNGYITCTVFIIHNS